MRSKDFQSVLHTASGVLRKESPKQNILKESLENINESELTLMNEINSVLEQVEKQLGIRLTESEIKESTSFILNIAQVHSLVEQIEAEVGFELNEDEVNYVVDKLITE